MSNIIMSFLQQEKIEYAGVLPFFECKVINRPLLERSCAGWIPQSAILFLIPYYSGEYRERNVSLYAVPRDYHLYFKMLYERLERELSQAFPAYHFKGFADHSAIGETIAAAKAGLGVIGDKFQLINPTYGSYTFIGEILTDMTFEKYDLCEIKTCSHCGACRRACPSPASCLSELTQRKGELTRETSEQIKKTGIAWGCDACQICCPMNSHVHITPIDYFKEELLPFVTTECVNTMDDTTFHARAYSWRGRKTILRNLLLLEDKNNQ